VYKVDRDAILRKYNWNGVCMETAKVYSSLQDLLSMRNRSAVRVSG
jgi:hypothetical protein